LVLLTFPVALGRDRLEHKKQVSLATKIARGGQRQAVRLLVGSQTNVSLQTHPWPLSATIYPVPFPILLQLMHVLEVAFMYELRRGGQMQIKLTGSNTKVLMHAH
jgi:hypothetical protein